MASIFSRKRDLVYLIFFITHIPVMLCVDLVGLYPKSLTPHALIDLRRYHVATYKDFFFVSPPTWFYLYIYLEALYHLPLSLWAIGALLRDDPSIPLQLLVFGLETAITTMTCVAEMLSWESHTMDEKIQLSYLYVPYFVFAAFMSIDMYLRLSAIIQSKTDNQKAKKN